MLNNRPVFGRECFLCLKCIYGCSNKALKAEIFKFILLKEEYDLKAIEKRMDSIKQVPIEDLVKGCLWEGVKEYLLEDWLLRHRHILTPYPFEIESFFLMPGT